MAVVGMNFGEAMFGGADEVEGVGGAEEGRVGGFPEELREPLLDGVGEREPMIEAIPGIADELLQNREVRALLETSFPESALKSRDDFRLSVPGAGDGGTSTGQLADHLESRIAKVEADQIRGVKEGLISGHRGRRRSGR